jgi:plasmid stabilization system protein ParE
MSYELAITPEAEQDLAEIVASLPAASRQDAWVAIVTEFDKLAANPSLAVRSQLGRPTYRFSFKVREVSYHWAATFKYSEDERSIVITHVFRLAL